MSEYPNLTLNYSENMYDCLFQSKIDGTLWKEIDDLKVFKVLDLEEFQKTFSAYQKPQVTHQSLSPQIHTEETQS